MNITKDEDVTKVLQKLQDRKDKVHNIDFTCCTLITDTALNLIGETFSHIKTLDLYGCIGITEEGMLKILSSNPNLVNLNFSSCKKVNGDAALQSVIDNCPSIETLIAEDVGITTIPTDIGTLQKLKLLDLDRNNITVVPRSILDLPTECKLDFFNNPLQEPPVSVIKDGRRDAMIAYYEDLEKGARISNKLKFVLLGTGEAGKTTIANILNGQTTNYMPAKDDRTIHLDLMTIPIHKDGHDPITLTVYDCGGQSKYAAGQVQFITSVGFYVLLVNAEEEDPFNITRFLVILQARAPGAVVQIVLSKTDLLNSSSEIESKKDWIHKHVQKFQKYNSKNDTEHKSAPLNIQGDIIDVSAKNSPTDTHNAIINRIFELSDASPPILPSVRQNVPMRWLAFERFLMAISAYGLTDTSKLCEAIKGDVEQQDNDNGTDNQAYSDENEEYNNEPHGSNGCLECRNLLLPFKVVMVTWNGAISCFHFRYFL
uniref:Roc domain-containing protein n=1 Tax=Chaetoceros debilis TaxID=122233 RepID=A0A7S3VED0_9STRA